MGGFNFIFCVAENFIKTVGFDFIVSNANDFIKNSESSTLSTKNIFSVPHSHKQCRKPLFSRAFGFLFLSKTRKTKKPQFFIGFFRLLTEFITDVVRLSGGFFYVILCVFLCLKNLKRAKVCICGSIILHIR